MGTDACMACDGNGRIGELPAREAIVVGEHWRVAHAFDSALPGWLVVMPRRHVTGLHDLTDDEVAPFGVLLRRLSQALVEVTGCEKAYLAFFAEKEGFSHLHVHVVPRMPDFADEVKGPRVFEHLRQEQTRWVSTDEQDRIAHQMRLALGEPARFSL